MLPVIAIVGRPNVGKSTLFNRLTRSQAALVADLPGLTRDRLYGEGEIAGQKFIAVDTGGLGGDKEGIAGLMEQQSWMAIQEADIILLVADARSGLTGIDQTIMEKLRSIAKPVYLVVNKIDGLDANVITSEFYRLGVEKIFPITAAHGEGVTTLMQSVLTQFPTAPTEEQSTPGIKMAIVGRPNVGKSTLVNRLLGEQRVLVYDQPGTTRDSIYIPFTHKNAKYTLIDTAGVRRRRGITEGIEKFSVIKTLQAVAAANVVVFVFDAQQGIADQDLHLLGFVLEEGKALVIAVNKWDELPVAQQKQIKNDIDRRLDFVNFAKIYFISALTGAGVNNIFSAVNKAYTSANRDLATPELTRILEAAVAAHQPPAVRGRSVKLRYAHQGGHNPPLIVIHGKQTESLAESYRRYLANSFRVALKLVGTPVRIEFKQDANPYKEKRQRLTPRQVHKRHRLLRFVKKKK